MNYNLGDGNPQGGGAPADGGKRAQSLDLKVTDVDNRARTGELTFSDFITMGESFNAMGSRNIPGMPELTSQQREETRAKFAKHKKIVEVMTPDELAVAYPLCSACALSCVVLRSRRPPLRRLVSACMHGGLVWSRHACARNYLLQQSDEPLA